jgi:hypothetical protein
VQAHARGWSARRLRDELRMARQAAAEASAAAKAAAAAALEAAREHEYRTLAATRVQAHARGWSARRLRDELLIAQAEVRAAVEAVEQAKMQVAPSAAAAATDATCRGELPAADGKSAGLQSSVRDGVLQLVPLFGETKQFLRQVESSDRSAPLLPPAAAAAPPLTAEEAAVAIQSRARGHAARRAWREGLDAARLCGDVFDAMDSDGCGVLGRTALLAISEAFGEQAISAASRWEARKNISREAYIEYWMSETRHRQRSGGVFDPSYARWLRDVTCTLQQALFEAWRFVEAPAYGAAGGEEWEMAGAATRVQAHVRGWSARRLRD